MLARLQHTFPEACSVVVRHEDDKFFHVRVWELNVDKKYNTEGEARNAAVQVATDLGLTYYLCDGDAFSIESFYDYQDEVLSDCVASEADDNDKSGRGGNGPNTRWCFEPKCLKKRKKK